MNREYFLKYAEILNKYEELSKNNEEIVVSSEDEFVINYVKDVSKTNEALKELMLKLHSLPSYLRKKAVIEFFDREKGGIIEEEEEDKNTVEEEISKTFGIDVSKINHSYLQSGVEIFYFYDESLNREVILQNVNKGKSLVDQLKKIQEENAIYQQGDSAENSKNILEDQRINSDIELQLVTKDNISSHQNEINNLSEEDLLKLNYLLTNYDRLHIKGINIENLMYIDEDNNIREVSFKNEKDIVVMEPSSVKYSNEEVNVNDPDSSIKQIYEADEEKNVSFDDLNDDMKERVRFYHDNPMLLDSIPDVKMREKWKSYVSSYDKKVNKEKEHPKVYTKADGGFINNAIFVMIMTVLFIGICLVISLIKI